MNRNIKYVIFDFDGTIADTFEIVLKALRDQAKIEKLDIDLDNNQFVQELRNFHARDLLRRFNISVFRIPKLTKEIRKILYKKMDNVHMFDGMDEAISSLKDSGYKLGILTSNSKEGVSKFLDRKDINDKFDFIYSKRNLFGKDKLLKKLVRKLKLNKSELVYVGDEARDVEASKKAGITCLAVEWGYNSKYALNEHGADYIVDSPEELLMKIEYLDKERVQ